MIDLAGRKLFPKLTRFERRRNLRALAFAVIGLAVLVIGVIYITTAVSGTSLSVQQPQKPPLLER